VVVLVRELSGGFGGDYVPLSLLLCFRFSALVVLFSFLSVGFANVGQLSGFSLVGLWFVVFSDDVLEICRCINLVVLVWWW
jgi:hypothetical protein